MERSWKSVTNLKRGHIFNKMQILILSYKAPGEVNEIGRQLCQAERIATLCVMAHDIQYKTQSEYWCPLIMEALKLAGYSIPNKWTNKYANPIIQSYATQLSKIPGWAEYAYKLINTFEPALKHISNNFNDKMYELADLWAGKIQLEINNKSISKPLDIIV
jgi:hypothetical protein